jgi:hypothetical protein
MGKCPQPVTDSSASVDTTVRKGYSFRVMPVEDTSKTVTTTTTVPKPEVTMAGNPSTIITPITTKKPIKL